QGYNFGELPIVVAPNNSVSGFVYVDTDDDGAFDAGEVGIAGVNVTLARPVSRTVVTGVDGSYLFDGLPDGVYTVSAEQPDGFDDRLVEQVALILGTLRADNSTLLPFTTLFRSQGYNFGELPIVVAPNNSISGFVYVDADDDG